MGHDAGDCSPVQPGHTEKLAEQRQTHSRQAECADRPAVKGRSGHIEQVEFGSGGSRTDLPTVGLSPDRPLPHPSQYYVSNVCVSILDPRAWLVDALSVDFQGLEAYGYPSQPLLSRILQKFQLVSQCGLLVVAT